LFISIPGGKVYGGNTRPSGLEAITIPDPVTSVGNYAFHDCSLFSSFELQNSITIKR